MTRKFANISPEAEKKLHEKIDLKISIFYKFSVENYRFMEIMNDVLLDDALFRFLFIQKYNFFTVEILADGAYGQRLRQIFIDSQI